MSRAPSIPALISSIALSVAACTAQQESGGGTGPTPPAFVAAGADVSLGTCPDEAKFVYVLSGDGDLYRFDPGQLSIVKLFPITCRSTSKDPRVDFIDSMAVDRQGAAWVQYGNGQMWKVDVKNGACEQTAYVPVPANRVFNAMAFVTDRSGSSAETLFVSGGDPYVFDDQRGFLTNVTFIGSVDPVSLRSTALGKVSDSFLNGQITGSGDGRLFAFYEDPPWGQDTGTSDAKIAELDKATGRAKSPITLPGFPMRGWLGLASWGGALWIFNGISETSTNSMLARVAPTTGKLDVMISDVGFQVVGAGVSTCAPTTGVN